MSLIFMKNSVFDPEAQSANVDYKIVTALERLSEAFRVLLWNEAKELSLSPIQIQILLFIRFHPANLSKVSYLAGEFNMTKATISDAVRMLEQKGLIQKETTQEDSRSFNIMLTPKGKSVTDSLEHFGQPIVNSLSGLAQQQKIVLLESLLGMIRQLQTSGVITIQRMCYSCHFFEKRGEQFYCNMLHKQLDSQDLRVDCPEFEATVTLY